MLSSVSHTETRKNNIKEEKSFQTLLNVDHLNQNQQKLPFTAWQGDDLAQTTSLDLIWSMHKGYCSIYWSSNMYHNTQILKVGDFFVDY